ncbi:snRNA-activating protein complex subunit 4 isoform X2 [Gouania willdenowi]|uniref:snRNA-activating protein complex subunit 4 isoform X2 n=1 Tax=Gouania willdenowi TaxID=441366 RepID=UPI0010551D0E|nr:snRNA-activating protein complex subunit 4 isoform X2 [Gouania willdenowi]
MSAALGAERDRIQREVEELERNLSVSQRELELLSSETDDESDSEDIECKETSVRRSSGLFAEKDKLQKEIQNLEEVLGDYRPVCDSDDDDGLSSESELGLSPSVDSCLQMNLVYQQVIQETLEQLQTLLTQNYRQQRELMCQLSGPIKEPSRGQNNRCPSYQQPITMYLGHFLKPYFKDKLTGLGPPANQETKRRNSKITGCLENNKFKLKRWQSWQRSLLIHCVSKDRLKRMIQPKLSKLEFLSLRLSSAVESDKQRLRDQINTLERDIELLREKKEEEMIGVRYEVHDWQKISNVDFEGLRYAEDIHCFWVNFLHPSINKLPWQPEEMVQLEAVARKWHHRHWDSIAEELGTGRTAFMCLQMFQRYISDTLKRSVWTPAEDDLLRELVDRMRIRNFIPYTQISYFMEGRQPNQLIYRWTGVLDPRLKKGPWTAEEDQLLLQAVSRHGAKNWFRICLEVPGRTDGSCRDRYLDCLKEGLKKGPFDSQEKTLLLQLVKKHGVGRWSKISAEIPQRNDAQCLRAWRALRKIQDRAVRWTPASSTKVKQEEEEGNSEEEEVDYMDSSEEDTVKNNVELDQDEVEDEYSVPPMSAWIPAEGPSSLDVLTFRHVAPPSAAEPGGQSVRCTLVGNSGSVTALYAPPAELKAAERHRTSSLLMMTLQQLQAHIRRLFRSLDNGKHRPRRTTQCGRRVNSGPLNDARLNNQLQAAVTPWVGNLLVPERQLRIVSDALREQVEKSRLSEESLLMLMKEVKREVITSQAYSKVGGVTAALTGRTPSLVNQDPAPVVHSSACLTRIQEAPQSLAHVIVLPSPSTLTSPSGLSLAPPPSVLTNNQSPCRSALNSDALLKVELSDSASRGQRPKPAISNKGLIQDRKRTRKPSQKVREQQGSTSENDELKKKKKKRKRSSTPSSAPPSPAPLSSCISVPPSAPSVLVFVGPWQAPPSAFQKPDAGLLDWLNGRGGGPYLPPSVCTLKALSELLRTRKALITSSKQLLSGQDSFQSSLTLKDNQRPGLSPIPEEDQQEAELISALRPMVRECFSANPAYRALKNHFLSCFTVSALLATIQPIREQSDTFQLEEEQLQEREKGELRDPGCCVMSRENQPITSLASTAPS